ncbi:hypothetical protein [uncultured Acinetobacter sp.]|uniref:DUF7668 domain-containing protein n=1 Tax=uncultured Acinetobacter sp. TaxID=165433 RepID=UPI0025E74A83|nr:hypothetical protein [uncultured Acinetobacter sp.]
MTQDIPVPYDSEFQSPIPNIWRDKIVQIVEAFKNKDFARLNTIPNVEFIDIEYAAEIAENIDDYGAHLISLPEESWNSSVCVYQGEYEESWDSSVCLYQGEYKKNHFWNATVDLFTEEEGCSDLIIDLRIYKYDKHYTYEVYDKHYTYEIMGIYVP